MARQMSLQSFFTPTKNKNQAIAEEWRSAQFPPPPLPSTPKRPVGRPRKRVLVIDDDDDTPSTPPTSGSVEEVPAKRGKYHGYSLAEKRDALDLVEVHGWRPISRKLNIPISTLHTWKKSLNLDSPMTKNGRKLGSGRPLTYNVELDDQILVWVLHQRELHLPVTRQTICDYAASKIPTPGFKASMGWLDKFMRRHSLVLRARTSLSQRLPRDLEERIRIFHQYIAQVQEEKAFDEELILNMDETPMFFDMVPGKTIDKCGVRDVIVRSTGSEKRRLTIVLAVTASGHVLPPMIIFKGKRQPKGLTVPGNLIVKMQPNAWMTADLMMDWLREVVRPYTQRRPTLLVMDSFTGHLADPVNKAMQRLNITKAIIPGGCTTKVQPLDVSINKPFKGHLRASWCRFLRSSVAGLLGSDGSLDKVSPATQREILLWISSAWSIIGQNKEMVKKSFEVCGITKTAQASGDEDLPLPVGFLDDDDEEFSGFPTVICSDSDDDPFS